jgi:hypothetical protein
VQEHEQCRSARYNAAHPMAVLAGSLRDDSAIQPGIRHLTCCQRVVCAHRYQCRVSPSSKVLLLQQQASDRWDEGCRETQHLVLKPGAPLQQLLAPTQPHLQIRRPSTHVPCGCCLEGIHMLRHHMRKDMTTSVERHAVPGVCPLSAASRSTILWGPILTV